jgi:hypothetical protein
MQEGWRHKKGVHSCLIVDSHLFELVCPEIFALVLLVWVFFVCGISVSTVYRLVGRVGCFALVIGELQALGLVRALCCYNGFYSVFH